MYNINLKKEFKMPLQTMPYDQRYKKLLNSNSKKKIVYIKNEFDNSTFRYRCYNFCQALNDSKQYEITYFLCSEIPSILTTLDKIDLIVFQRTTWTIEVENLLYLAKQKRISTVYDMDDLLYQSDYVPSYINHIGQPFNLTTTQLYFSIATGYDMVAKKCDCYITTTNYLKNKLEQSYKKPVYVIPNFLNNEQLIESNIIVRDRKIDKDKFVIGYFSGSPSHKNDFRVIENDLIRLMEKYDDIYLKIVGFIQLEGKLKQYQNQGRIFFKELVPYQELQYEIGSVDLNIIPLVNNEFNQGKSELKYFESAIVKVASCITPTDVYKNIIKDYENAVFCKSGEWFKNIEKLYLHSDLLKKIAKNAYDSASEIYLPNIQKTKIEKVYNEILKS